MALTLVSEDVSFRIEHEIEIAGSAHLLKMAFEKRARNTSRLPGIRPPDSFQGRTLAAQNFQQSLVMGGRRSNRPVPTGFAFPSVLHRLFQANPRRISSRQGA